jgi:hypothetical protein
MTLPLPGNPVEDFNIQQKFDAIALAWQDNRSQTSALAAATQVDVPVQSTDKLLIIEWDVELSGLAELRLHPNASVAANYSDVRDGSYQLSTPASVAVAAAGAVNHNNGIRLSYAPAVAIAGGVKSTGRATFGAGIPPSGSRRLCRGDAAVSSLTNSANHIIELQNIATLWNDATAVTSLRFLVNTGTMTGRIRVTRG